MLYIVMFLLALCSTALAQIEPAAPGSVEFTLTAENYTWVETSDPITIGGYVEDLLTDRLGQPAGRGALGIVTATAFDPDYGVEAATVDFGNDYSAGIVFPELSAVELVAVPEPSPALILVPGILLGCAVIGRRAKASS